MTEQSVVFRRVRRSFRWRLGWVVTGVLAVLVAGCTTIPSGGGVHAGAPKGDSNQAGAQAHAPALGPLPGASPDQIVAGFRLASADSAGLAVAREFLVDPNWLPEQGVHVIDDSGAPPSYLSSGNEAKLHYVDSWAGTIGADGTYQPQKPGTKSDYTYEVVKNAQTKGEWRIVNAPPYMTATVSGVNDFYKPAYLYYLSPRDQLLVPVRVFLPQTGTDPATELVTQLLQPPPRWLAAAGITTAFPPDTALIGNVLQIEGVVIVNLASEVASLSVPERDALSAQLVYTLQGYGDGGFKIEVAGQPLANSRGVTVQSVKTWSAYDPDSLKVDFYYTGADHRTRDSTGFAVPGDAGSGAIKLSVPVVAPRLATTTGGDLIAGVETSGSTQALFVGPLAQPKPVDLGISFTTPSWDAFGDVWTVRQETATGAQEVRVSAVTPAGTTKFETVANKELAPSDLIESLKVSRDGTRVAVIARSTTAGAQLLVGHVVKTASGESIAGFYPVAPGLAPVGDVVWASATTLDVIAAAPGESSPSVWSVDVDGWNQPSLLTAPSDAVSIAAAPGEPLAVGTKSHQIEVSRNEFWQVVGAGSNPSYPG